MPKNIIYYLKNRQFFEEFIHVGVDVVSFGFGTVCFIGNRVQM